jgi:hypothetical protein
MITLDNGCLSILNSDWVTIDQTLFNSIAAIAWDSETGPMTLATVDPVSHMGNRCITGTGGRALASGVNNSLTSLLDSWVEFFLQPSLVNKVCDPSTVTQSSVTDIWVHCWTVVTPNAEIMNIINVNLFSINQK